LDAARIGNDAEADLGQRECGALGRDDQIAGERKLKSAAEGEAIDRRNDRLVEFEKLRQAGEAARAVIGARRLPFRRGLEIPSGGIVKANKYRRFSASNPAEGVGDS